ncbi:BamA/TamA family outer membrane protein [Carboxylicivirga sp. N1Y90]|uniref:BamA/TamA family outer membrane protein n=1 Tax=Carboxylicivirga fragile TaxID=3417571 RepID=UPI003D327A70|nr:BamA/TamA family outer membrane protein [Marinilabiliaceae bacterium N1Y90]
MHLGFLVMILIVTSHVYAQDDTLSYRLLDNLDSLRFAKVEREGFKIMPYVAPSYTPETDFLLTAGGLITFKAQRWNNLLNTSSVPFSVGYSSNGSFTLNIQNVIYWADDNIRTIGEFIMKEMPDNYWGVGYENGLDERTSRETTFYTRRYWRFNQRFMFRTKGDMFLGGIIDLNGTKAFDMNPVMEMDEYVLRSGSDVLNTGLGFVFEYDSRDFVQNAYSGKYFSASMVFFQEYLGGNTKYRVFEFDYRHYKTIKRKRRTLAWQAKCRFNFGGEVPWSDMAMLGGPYNMRGYTLGRFRDKNSMSLTGEYRHMFKRKKLNKKGNYDSRFGYVVWMAAGSVMPSLDVQNNWLPNGGVGLRVEIQPRMNIRIDYGIGKSETGFYATFSEAF